MSEIVLNMADFFVLYPKEQARPILVPRVTELNVGSLEKKEEPVALSTPIIDVEKPVEQQQQFEVVISRPIDQVTDGVAIFDATKTDNEFEATKVTEQDVKVQSEIQTTSDAIAGTESSNL